MATEYVMRLFESSDFPKSYLSSNKIPMDRFPFYITSPLDISIALGNELFEFAEY